MTDDEAFELILSCNKIHDKEQLKKLQSLTLEQKIQATKIRISEWYQHWDGEVYVSFSGGKDSTVLLNIVRSMYPEVPAVFCDTGLEYPEIRNFVKSVDNVTWLKPEMNFRQVIEKYGYPVISKDVSLLLYYANHSKNKKQNYINDLKGLNPDGSYSNYNQQYKKYEYLLSSPFSISNKCCFIMKEKLLDNYKKSSNKKPIVGIMSVESVRRKKAWIQTGCNAFDTSKPSSKPISFWTEQDVLEYLQKYNIPYANIYGGIKVDKKGNLFTTGEKRTGCMFCMYGVQCENEPNRFQRMKITHPKLYEYCMRDWDNGGLGLAKVLDFIGVNYK